MMTGVGTYLIEESIGGLGAVGMDEDTAWFVNNEEIRGDENGDVPPGLRSEMYHLYRPLNPSRFVGHGTAVDQQPLPVDHPLRFPLAQAEFPHEEYKSRYWLIKIIVVNDKRHSPPLNRSFCRIISIFTLGRLVVQPLSPSNTLAVANVRNGLAGDNCLSLARFGTVAVGVKRSREGRPFFNVEALLCRIWIGKAVFQMVIIVKGQNTW